MCWRDLLIEAGETLEQALRQKVAEEVNLRVQDLRYFSGQSWPFPAFANGRFRS